METNNISLNSRAKAFISSFLQKASAWFSSLGTRSTLPEDPKSNPSPSPLSDDNFHQFEKENYQEKRKSFLRNIRNRFKKTSTSIPDFTENGISEQERVTIEETQMFILPEESVREVFTTILSEGEVYGVNQQ
ncbi:MAG: hypothetical protein AAFY41_18870, partial [Bacteroidota bacterium]